jgi:putative flippase GtrA
LAANPAFANSPGDVIVWPPRETGRRARACAIAHGSDAPALLGLVPGGAMSTHISKDASMRVDSKRELRRMLVFAIVGALNVAATYLAYAVLVAIGWHYNLALVASYVLCGGLAYALHRASTFADRAHIRQGLGKYAVTLGVTFVVNFALLDALVVRRVLAPLAAQAVAMGVATLVGYLMQTHWVFRSHAAPDDAVDDTPRILERPAADAYRRREAA